MSGGLAGLRVLVTRPEGRGEALCELLRAAGVHVVYEPLLRIEPLDPVADAEQLARAEACFAGVAAYRRLIFVSSNAVEFGWPLLVTAAPQPLPELACYAVGASTAAALAERGVPAAQPGGAMNTEALLALPAMQQVAGEACLIVRGVGGREALAEALRERGARVDYAECYRRLPAVIPAAEFCLLLEKERFDAVCLNSGETLAIYRGLQRDSGVAGRSPALVVPGERVARAARQDGFERVIVADNAGDNATLAALETLADRGK